MEAGVKQIILKFDAVVLTSDFRVWKSDIEV